METVSTQQKSVTNAIKEKKTFDRAMNVLRDVEFKEYYHSYMITTSTDNQGYGLPEEQRSAHRYIVSCGAPAGGMNPADNAGRGPRSFETARNARTIPLSRPWGANRASGVRVSSRPPVDDGPRRAPRSARPTTGYSVIHSRATSWRGS